MDWLVIRSGPEYGAAHFSSIRNFDKKNQLKNAVSLKATFPADTEVQMTADLPDEIELVDCLNVPFSALIVNEKVGQLFERAGVKNVELLPIRVINHKKKAVKERYFVANILSHVDCVDVKKSQGVEWNDIDPKMIDSIKKMVLDPARLPADLKLFRLKNMKYVTLVHRSLADQIKAEGMRGFAFTEIAEFRE